MTVNIREMAKALGKRKFELHCDLTDPMQEWDEEKFEEYYMVCRELEAVVENALNAGIMI